MNKPGYVFDRDHEWSALDTFVSADRPGAMLGLMYGRRRQGKTFLLETLAAVNRGFYFAALQQSSAQNLRRMSEQYQVFTRGRARVEFATWEQVLESLLALGEGAAAPVVVVLDEFPYLLDAAPELPSLLQSLLSPRGRAARGWRTRVILCGSALSTMQGLLSGTAPLRGRSSLELQLHPFDYRDAAAFWQVADDPDLALRLHALVGGTAAYRDMVPSGQAPSARSFDTWVTANLLNPSSAMFREGNVLLSEQPHVQDSSVYFAVLAAISQGRTRRSEIAGAVGKSEGALAHPLTVLTQARLIRPLADALRQKRTTYHVDEPVLRLHQLLIAPNESRLTRHQQNDVWAQSSGTVSAQIFGPHFEQVARVWCAEYASDATLGGTAGRVGPTVLACREHGPTGGSHEVDAVVLDGNRRILAIAEAKWRTSPVDSEQLTRLEHLRDLLSAPPGTKLLLFGRAGFTPALTRTAATRDDVELVDAERLYAGE